MLTTSKLMTHQDIENILNLQWEIEYYADEKSGINYIVSKDSEKQHELFFAQSVNEELMDVMALLRLLSRAKLVEKYGTVFTMLRLCTENKMNIAKFNRQVKELTLAMKTVEIWDFDLIYRYWPDIILNDHQWNINNYKERLGGEDGETLLMNDSVWELIQNITIYERFNLPNWDYNPILEHIFSRKRTFYDCDARLTINDLIQFLIHLPELTDDSVSGLEELEKAINQFIDIFAFTAKPKLKITTGVSTWILSN